MKIITILTEDPSDAVRKQIKALKGKKFQIHGFTPQSNEQEKAIAELTKLCEKQSLHVAQLEHYLFTDNLTTDPIFSTTLKNLDGPFVLSNLPS